MDERIISTAKAFCSGIPASKIVVIPKKVRQILGEENTDFFVVKLDRKGRIIFEPIKNPQSKSVAVQKSSSEGQTGASKEKPSDNRLQDDATQALISWQKAQVQDCKSCGETGSEGDL